MAKQPLVSIVIPCYNSEKTIARALQSVLNQTYQNWEALVVDDGSTDQTKSIVQRFQDSRIRYFEFTKNKGRAAARQKALDEAMGTYLSMLDSDDWIFSNKIEDQVFLMESNPDVKVLSGHIAIVDEDNVLCGFRKSNTPSNSILTFDRITPPAIPHAVSMIRMDHAKKFKYNLKLKHSQDSDFLLKALYQQRYYLSDQIWYVYSELASVNKKKISLSYYYTITYLSYYIKSHPLQASREIFILFSKMIYHTIFRRFQNIRQILLKRSVKAPQELQIRFSHEKEKLEQSLKRKSNMR